MVFTKSVTQFSMRSYYDNLNHYNAVKKLPFQDSLVSVDQITLNNKRLS